MVLQLPGSGHQMALSTEEVQHIAWLARLGVSEDEIERFRVELSAILDHFRVLQALDTASVPAAPHASLLQNVMRDDMSRPSLPPDSVLANAPDSQDSCFRVASILE